MFTHIRMICATTQEWLLLGLFLFSWNQSHEANTMVFNGWSQRVKFLNSKTTASIGLNEMQKFQELTSWDMNTPASMPSKMWSTLFGCFLLSFSIPKECCHKTPKSCWWVVSTATSTSATKSSQCEAIFEKNLSNIIAWTVSKTDFILLLTGYSVYNRINGSVVCGNYNCNRHAFPLEFPALY